MNLHFSMNQEECSESIDVKNDWPPEEDSNWLRDDSWNNSEWPSEYDWGNGTIGNSHLNNSEWSSEYDQKDGRIVDLHLNKLLEQIDDMNKICIVKSIKSILLFSHYKKIQYFFSKWVENKTTILYLNKLIEEKSKCVEIESMLITERITCANLSLKLLQVKCYEYSTPKSGSSS